MNTQVNEMQVTHISTAALLLEIGPFRILTDPTFDKKGTRYSFGPGAYSKKLEDSFLRPDQIGAIDLVLLSHHHHLDNYDYTAKDFVETSAVKEIISTQFGLESLLKSQPKLREKTKGLEPWETHILQDETSEFSLSITATPALHGRYEKWPGFGRRTMGYVLTWNGQQEGVVYFAGDTIWNEELLQVKEHFASQGGIGTVFLPAGGVRFLPLFFLGRHTLHGTDFTKTALALGAKRVIPIHYDGWAHFVEPLSSLKSSIAKEETLKEKIFWLSKGNAITLPV